MKEGWFLWIDKEKEKIRMSTEYQTIEEFDTKWGGRPDWNVDVFEFQEEALMLYHYNNNIMEPNDFPIENEVDGSEGWMLKKIKELDEYFQGDMIPSDIIEAWHHGARGWMVTQQAKIMLLQGLVDGSVRFNAEVYEKLEKIEKRLKR